MRRAFCFPVVALILAVSPASTLSASQANNGGQGTQCPDFAALIGGFPRPGSDGAKADLAILLWLQQTRTPGQLRRAESEVKFHLGIFSEVTGKDLESGPYPLTRALAEDLQRALGQVVATLKTQYARPRPFEANSQIRPAIALAVGFSYPSGHASWGMAQASLLEALEPQRREAIVDRGMQVGYDRVLGGVHYPSDVEAGQRLGAAFAQYWLALPAHRKHLEQARSEW